MTMELSITRRLVEAVGSWMHLEVCCYRAGLFSESALKSVVGQILSSLPISNKGVRAYADFAHEALNPLNRVSPGRDRSVDFALVLAGDGLAKKEAELLIEVKWAASAHCSLSNIFKDFLRLAILKRANPQARCIFLLAGPAKHVQTVMNSTLFKSPKGKKTTIGVSGSQTKLVPDNSNTNHVKLFSSAISSLRRSGLEIPVSFTSLFFSPFPAISTTTTIRFQAVAWEITAADLNNIHPRLWPKPEKRSYVSKTPEVEA
jgi:hypothetical protein